ncbi:IS3 family transposase [Virgibacillus proomii]|uniref:IS3 family transposase n=1 Tax=Virgibacillus proomii TaxID=84407 RepID=UPI001C11F59E|nr:IS3 family transposase [Virgibacillus proomii]
MKALASIPQYSSKPARSLYFSHRSWHEFDNQITDEALAAFQIERSLSTKECPYDNALAESTFKSFKTEFMSNRNFDSLKQLKLELADYVHWFKYCRLHKV